VCVDGYGSIVDDSFFECHAFSRSVEGEYATCVGGWYGSDADAFDSLFVGVRAEDVCEFVYVVGIYVTKCHEG